MSFDHLTDLYQFVLSLYFSILHPFILTRISNKNIFLARILFLSLLTNMCSIIMLVVIKCCSVTKSCPTLCDPRDCSTPGFLSFTVSWSVLKFMSLESVMLSHHLILCSLLLLPSIFPSIRVFSIMLALCIR